MTDADEQAALDVFERMLDLDAAGRSAFLEANCDNENVRARVLALLAADARAEGLLEKGADEHLATMAFAYAPPPRMPEQIGPYRIVERLGEGGMATVYRPERREADFQLTVALKLISPLRQTEHWLQRFVQERRILASLSTPISHS